MPENSQNAVPAAADKPDHDAGGGAGEVIDADNTVFLVNRTGGVISGAVIHSVGFVISPFLPQPVFEARLLSNGESASGITAVSHKALDYWLVPVAINAINDFFILARNTGFRPSEECNSANDG